MSSSSTSRRTRRASREPLDSTRARCLARSFRREKVPGTAPIASTDEGTPHHFRNSNQRKNGAPRNAVITPTGSSAGATMVLAATSQSTRKAPPKTADDGSSNRCPGPSRRRQMWGDIMPTKPMGPQAATTPADHHRCRHEERRSRLRHGHAATGRELGSGGEQIEFASEGEDDRHSSTTNGVI